MGTIMGGYSRLRVKCFGFIRCEVCRVSNISEDGTSEFRA